MNYWELRSQVKDLVPRSTRLSFKSEYFTEWIKEKGRKTNYMEGDLSLGIHVRRERLLNPDEIGSLINVSIRAMGCPLPLNIDTWDGFICPYDCIYCFANSFRASLYKFNFDNAQSVGLRHCNPESFKKKLDVLMIHRGKTIQGVKDEAKAVSLSIPIRFGIQFEDFLPIEGKKKISLSLLKYLSEQEYPVMINTKSDLIGREDYVRILSDNKAGTAVHLTMITSNRNLEKKLEPGAPSFGKRIRACKNLSDAGIKVVARIEPFMIFLNDDKRDVDKYIEALKWAGVKSLTFDTYSYSAYFGLGGKRARESFYQAGYDFNRMFWIMSDCQWLGSLVMGKFMDYFRSEGFQCSTFDFGNVPFNDDDLCCSVDDIFGDFGYNRGNILSAARFIIHRGKEFSAWGDFELWVEEGGGFLSDSLRKEVMTLWNLENRNAYQLDWIPGLFCDGVKDMSLVWHYEEGKDFRWDMFHSLLENI